MYARGKQRKKTEDQNITKMMRITLEMTDDHHDNDDDSDDDDHDNDDDSDDDEDDNNDDNDNDDDDEWKKEEVVVFQDDGAVVDCGVLNQPQTTQLLGKYVQSGTPGHQVWSQYMLTLQCCTHTQG